MRRQPSIPLWLKLAYSLWFVVWVPVYYALVGPANFLWLCDVGNIVLLIALWSESRALFSATAVGVVLVQLLWCVDLLGRLTLGFHPIGGTEYMLDAAEPLVVRALSFYHLWVPILLLWALYRLGFDRRAWRIQTLILWIILPLSYLQDPALNLNWLWRPFGLEQTLMPPAVYMVLNLALYPLLLFVPSQWLLETWLRRRGRPIVS
ncbi:MAG: hypothetical protein O7A04_10205 [Acidobacteria bacterium]|nr:hypothetical protein [Acidobacteriota bacterium]